MGMKVWLVILASWGGHPAAIKQMPGMASCRAVASTVVEMSAPPPTTDEVDGSRSRHLGVKV